MEGAELTPRPLLDNVARYIRTEKGKAANRRKRKYNPHKYAARDAVNKEIRAGRMRRLPCEQCGEEKTDAHHDDYEKQLEVRWLCRKHHTYVHREMKLAASLLSQTQ